MTLMEVRTALERRLGGELTSAALFTSVNTRLILRTGVNLKLIRPEQNEDPVTVARVREALGAMGFSLTEARP